MSAWSSAPYRKLSASHRESQTGMTGDSASPGAAKFGYRHVLASPRSQVSTALLRYSTRPLA